MVVVLLVVGVVLGDRRATLELLVRGPSETRTLPSETLVTETLVEDGSLTTLTTAIDYGSKGGSGRGVWRRV